MYQTNVRWESNTYFYSIMRTQSDCSDDAQPWACMAKSVCCSHICLKFVSRLKPGISIICTIFCKYITATTFRDLECLSSLNWLHTGTSPLLSYFYNSLPTHFTRANLLSLCFFVRWKELSTCCSLSVRLCQSYAQ